MKKSLSIKIFILFIICFPVFANGKDIVPDEFLIGKIDFIEKSGKEGIVVLSSPEKWYLLNKGVMLLIKRGSETITLKVNDVDGKYIRCVLKSSSSGTLLIAGEDVYYSDSLNSGIKYRDAKKIILEMIKLYEKFILKVESTEDPRLISDAVKIFTFELDKLIPEMKRINSKYPELEKFNLSPPAELQNESAMLEVLETRLRDAFFKVKMYSTDENVKKATEDLQKVLSKINSGR